MLMNPPKKGDTIQVALPDGTKTTAMIVWEPHHYNGRYVLEIQTEELHDIPDDVVIMADGLPRAVP